MIIMSDLKKYIVTLKKHEDLEEFYIDMETPGGNLYIPNRSIDVAARRPKSRNTHYFLTEEEAELIRKDPRVLDVVLEDLVISIRKPAYVQTTSTWNKQFINTNTHVNWGILRSYEGEQRTNWGEDGTLSQTGSVTINAEGRNVDVIIVDGHINPDHPEFAVNSDGTGGSRINQYNWLQHTNSITGGANGDYSYTPYVDGGNVDRTDDNNHGCHVAGTVAGNTQGWARSSTIYNISPYITNQNANIVAYLYDYIKEFHINKPVNSVTGKKNPTIINCSYGSEVQLGQGDFGSITGIVYRGNYIDTPAGATVQEMTDRGIYTTTQTPKIPYYTNADLVDIEDLTNLGIVIVAAAGNTSFYTCRDTDQDWNNYAIATYLGAGPYAWYYHRGTAPSTISNVISVGAVGNTVNETKATFSNCGPRVDIYAPGRAIMSSLNDGGTIDPRNSSYRIGKYQGTSMASPQVCGVLACALEIYPEMNQEQAREYIIGTSKLNQMADTGGSYTDLTSLNGSPNRYLHFRQERPINGNVFPKINYKLRPNNGVVFPRYRRNY